MKWFQPPAFVYLNRENLKWIVWCTIGLWREYAQMQPIWDSTISVEQNVVIFIKILLPLSMQRSYGSQECSWRTSCEGGNTVPPLMTPSFYSLVTHSTLKLWNLPWVLLSCLRGCEIGNSVATDQQQSPSMVLVKSEWPKALKWASRLPSRGI